MSRLPADSYTARRLEHATPEHLHYTTRRTFIGPIPEGWLSHHRKHWYRHHVSSSHSRAPRSISTAAHPISTATSELQQSQAAAHGAEEVGTPRPSSQSADTRARPDVGGSASSTTSLLHSQRGREQGGTYGTASASQQDGTARDVERTTTNTSNGHLDRVVSKLALPKVRFNEATKFQMRSRAQRLAERGGFRSSKAKPGELLKMDKMLMRIDVTQQSIKDGFDERVSQGILTKPLDKWREFMVVCRKHDEGALLQFYQTRVIATTADKTKKRPKSEIVLRRGEARANMYSSLDKTLCLWKVDRGRTYIYFLRPQSGVSSVDWFTFLHSVLGYSRTQTLQVNVPQLSVSLRLDNPFTTPETSQLLAEAAEGNDDALAKAITDEGGVAGAIVSRCVEMLKESPEWAEVLKSWVKYDRLGLAWKRYDRLEWIYGAAEQRMYGTVAMQATHDLELRPKDHYPVDVKTKQGETVEEPPAIEGFLIRLTSQKGLERRRMGKTMYKQLYFASQNQYLIFTRPARAIPPPPPKTPSQNNGNIPSAQQILKETPLTHDINPYPLEGQQISWLSRDGTDNVEEQQVRDAEAEREANRNLQILLACDGFIDMCDVKSVRTFHRGAIPADEALDNGSDVDFHASPPNRRGGGEDGQASEVDDDRMFELLMKNGLLIRLQAYSKEARVEWMKRLQPLVRYWQFRASQDSDLFKSVRQQNLDALQIDERAEAQIGSFAYKWEVSQSYASPILYNMCGIASCRSIHVSGVLFRKPRHHSTFTRCHVILSHGHMLIFQDTLRKHTGKKLVHSHLERLGSVDLRGCYLYSGLLTENNLLYQNQTFDNNMPGHHALPRIYLEDAWTSSDEDAMTTFVIWHAKSKSWFRSSQSVDDVRASERMNSINSRGEVDDGRTGRTKTRLTRVSQLGTTGRSVVFKARSRAERDHWVLAIQVEIERLAAQNEEVRLVDAGGQ
ncbi:Pleckstrin homology domain-containing protein [Neohortaea acidophila]|uniref:Pleckstrin homology domain-containing protein n=1 Tax=Neohortaea acidophila TaxID=245834 RepID=A0A6A6PJ30_9PEZI|nr:Pleckstrin homology domain-containing protein [Neohortaea acidophila]KAF2479796.1 Pleckstrin homology domain-containing protein [Neohortaea acidophila]